MKKVWEGVFEVWDLGFGKMQIYWQDTGFYLYPGGEIHPKTLHRMQYWKESSIQEYREAEVKNMGLSGKKEWECRIRIPHSRLCMNMRWSFIKLFQDMYKEQSGGETGALKDCLKETFPSLRVAAPSPWQSKNGEREGAVTRRLY